MVERIDTDVSIEKQKSLEEYTESLLARGYEDIGIIQTSKGNFSCSTTIKTIGEISIALRQVEASYICNVLNDKDTYSLLIFEGNHAQSFNGQLLDNTSLYVLRPGANALANFEKNASVLSIRIPKHKLEQYTPSPCCSGTKFTGLAAFHSTAQVNTLKTLLYNILSLRESLTQQSCLDTEERILLLFCEIMDNDCFCSKKVPADTRYRVVTRAIDFILSSQDKNLSVIDICQHAHCSLRTLEYSFKKVIGVTPKQYLTLLRMHNIRDELPNYSKENYSYLLDKYGIVNRSRFFMDYKTFFGENDEE